MTDPKSREPDKSTADKTGLEAEGRLFGKYRGEVIENIDPLDLKRLKLDVPAVPNSQQMWALPCIPYAGLAGAEVGFHIIPPVGAHVWVEFEGGDPSHPIWTGCYWDTKDEFPTPSSINSDDPPKVKCIKTDTTTFILDDTVDNKGGVTLEVDTPAVEEKVTLIFNNDGALLTTGISSIAVHPKDGITLKVDSTTLVLTKDDITLDTGAVTSKSSKDTTVNAGGGLTLEASQAASLSSGTSMEVKAGSSGTVEASGSLNVKAGGSNNVEAGGSLALKGSTVAVSGGTISLN